MKMKFRNLLVIAAALVFAVSCNNGEKKASNETAFNSKGVVASDNSKLLTIKLALHEPYAKKTACACVHNVAAREYEELQAKLKAEFNIDLQIEYFVETYDMEDELPKRNLDGVICKPWTAFMLAPKHNINYKRIADIMDPFGKQWLTGQYLVLKESDIKTLADAKGKTFCIGQPDAYEKYHSPKAIMDAENIVPGKEYQKASCLEIINELVDKKCDVGVVSDYVMCASCAVDIASPEDFRMIKETETMPLTSLILDMDKVTKEDALRLQKALLACSGKNAPESMLSDGFVLPAKWVPVPYVKK